MTALLALFIRTLREHGRARSTCVMRTLIGALVLLFLFVVRAQFGWAGAPGKMVFGLVMGLNYTLVTLAGVGVCAAVVAEEKEEGTLGLLRMTGLSGLSILLGKGVGRLVTLLLLLAVQIPFVLLAVTLGGVAVWQVMTAYLLLGTYLAATAGVALFFSTYFSRVWLAATATLGVGFGFVWLPEWLRSVSRFLGWLNDKGDGPLWLDDAALWFSAVNPFVHLGKLSQGSYLSLEVGRSVAVHLTIAVAGFLLAWLVFERRCGSEATYGEGAVTARRQLFRAVRRSRPGSQHPVQWKDYHFLFGGRLANRARCWAYPLMLAIDVAGGWGLLTVERFAGHLVSLGKTAFCIEAVIFAQVAWGSERWSRNLSSLLLTPRTLVSLHLEKLRAAWLALLPAVALIVLGTALDTAEWADFFHEQPTSHTVTMPNGTTRTVAVPQRLRVKEWASTGVQLALVLSLTLNFSLRLRWAAIPAALGAWVLAQILTSMIMVFPIFMRSTLFGRGGGFNFQTLYETVRFLVFGGGSVWLLFNTQRQIRRLAVES